jgi:hypothetical protein
MEKEKSRILQEGFQSPRGKVEEQPKTPSEIAKEEFR